MSLLLHMLYNVVLLQIVCLANIVNVSMSDGLGFLRKTEEYTQRKKDNIEKWYSKSLNYIGVSFLGSGK